MKNFIRQAEETRRLELINAEKKKRRLIILDEISTIESNITNDQAALQEVPSKPLFIFLIYCSAVIANLSLALLMEHSNMIGIVCIIAPILWAITYWFGNNRSKAINENKRLESSLQQNKTELHELKMELGKIEERLSR